MQMISAINAELAKIGYKAVKLPKRLTVSDYDCLTVSIDRLTVLKKWKPQTQGGRSCKSWMLYWASMPKPHFSLLPDLLALFGYRLSDVQPWPHCHKGNYGPALANACRNGQLLLTDYGRMADGSPVNVVLGRAADPVKRIYCLAYPVKRNPLDIRIACQ